MVMLIAYGCGMSRSVDDELVDDGLIAYGCEMIRSVDDELLADGLITYGCGTIDSDSDVVDGLVVNVISGSSDGRMWTGDKNLRSVRTVTLVRINLAYLDKRMFRCRVSKKG